MAKKQKVESVESEDVVSYAPGTFVFWKKVEGVLLPAFVTKVNAEVNTYTLFVLRETGNIVKNIPAAQVQNGQGRPV